MAGGGVHCGEPAVHWRFALRAVIGSGYTDALRATYSELPESLDYVLYWWNAAAQRTRQGMTTRFGLITTNSIRQSLSRRLTSEFIGHDLSLIFAVPDHPWVDDTDGAAVRIAMTCVEQRLTHGRLYTVEREQQNPDGTVHVDLNCRSGRITPELRIGVAIGDAVPLLANSRMSSPGVKLHGAGFIVTQEEASALMAREPASRALLRQYLNGKDVLQRNRAVLVIDTFSLELADLQRTHPVVLNWLCDRVLPHRAAQDTTADALEYSARWWMFGKPRPELRKALKDLPRFVVTPETAKHRVFVFVSSNVLPDNMLIVMATADAADLAVLSSRIHSVWALAAGGTLEDRPRYNKTKCFDPFPFATVNKETADRLRLTGEALDRHRKSRQATQPDLTLTAMYNVLEKVRAGEPLSAKDRIIHDQGLVSVLKQLHDELDAAVFDAYGWPHDLTDEQILERLVALNAERAEEERRGIIRWLRPEFQNPAGAAAVQATAGFEAETPAAAAAADEQIRPWPKALPAQIASVREVVFRNASESWTAERAARAFKGAKRTQVEIVLESLSALGLLVTIGDTTVRQWTATR